MQAFFCLFVSSDRLLKVIFSRKLTELVPRICRLGLSDSSSLRTIFRKLSTNRLMLWQWQAISSWSRASMAMHTYLKRGGRKRHRNIWMTPLTSVGDRLCVWMSYRDNKICEYILTAHSSNRNKNVISSARRTLAYWTDFSRTLPSVNVIRTGCLHWRDSSQCVLIVSHKRQQLLRHIKLEQSVQNKHHPWPSTRHVVFVKKDDIIVQFLIQLACL